MSDNGTTDVGRDSPLAAKLASIAGDLDRFPKTERTSGKGAYAFAGVDAMADHLRPAMAALGVVMYPAEVTIVESQRYVRERADRETGAAFQTIEWRTVLLVRWCVTDGHEAIPVMSTGEALDTSDKSANKAETAARKNAMKALFNVSTGDDPDPDATRPGEHVNEPVRRAQDASSRAGRRGGSGDAPPPPPPPQPSPDEQEQFVGKLRVVAGLADEDWLPKFATWLANETGGPVDEVRAWLDARIADSDERTAWPPAMHQPRTTTVHAMLVRKEQELIGGGS